MISKNQKERTYLEDKKDCRKLKIIITSQASSVFKSTI